MYTDTEFAHKHIVVGEGSGLHQDGIGATIVRAIAWEGHVEYETVEKGPDGKLHTRRIMKSGPTGIITTSVKPLHDELSTRVLTVTVRDDPEQTKLILKETGRRAKTRPARVDVSAFVAAQQWIRLAGRHEVVIPYADVLAELVDPSEVRIRRDFPQTLSLIQASAALHQRQRDRDDQGRIVASFEDYELIHEMVEESLKSATGSLTSAQRAAVEAVHTLYESGQQELVTVAAVAKALGIDRSAASRRLVGTPWGGGTTTSRSSWPSARCVARWRKRPRLGEETTMKMIGQPINRGDGPVKVTGLATYVYEHWEVGQPLYGFIVGATIGRAASAESTRPVPSSRPGCAW